MKTEIQKVLCLKNFFKICQSYGNTITYNLKKPSIILMNNVHIKWLQFVYSKTHKHMHIFTDKKLSDDKHPLPYGCISNDLITYNEDSVLKHNIGNSPPSTTSQIELNLVVPHQDIMQYFVQWQRYRKYWWSSITTTPSLFAINEINYGDKTTEASIVAQFPWGHHNVETIATHKGINPKSSILKCSLAIENAMLILLLDGLNNTKHNYLRLHRNMAPYKISFALQTEEPSNKKSLIELAELMNYRLKIKDISTCMPDFTHLLEQQIRENLQLGVTYTAILYDDTLTNGIFSLLNSSTMLKEEVHVADFDTYASLICRQ